MRNRFNIKKLWIGVLWVTFTIGLIGCGGDDGVNFYDVRSGIGSASEREYHDCLVIQKYDGGMDNDPLGPPTVYCKED